MHWFASANVNFSVRFTHVITFYCSFELIFSVNWFKRSEKLFHFKTRAKVCEGVSRKKHCTCKIYLVEFKTDFFNSRWVFTISSRVIFHRSFPLFAHWVVVKKCFLLHEPCETSIKAHLHFYNCYSELSGTSSSFSSASSYPPSISTLIKCNALFASCKLECYACAHFTANWIQFIVSLVAQIFLRLASLRNCLLILLCDKSCDRRDKMFMHF